MLKITAFFLCLVWHSNLWAQQENKIAAARYKFSAADSLLTLAVPVKNQLHQLLKNKKQQEQPLHLVFIAVDKTVNTNTSRWLAAKQQQDIYRVNLSAIVSKYIGETEKNLAQVFSAAEEKNYILVFDEADALFGQRSSNQKESNSSITYFLQRIAACKGTIIITCIGDNCVSQLAKQNFITVAAAQ